ncbi:pitrilysin family protein [Rapidithrix thailandica]|uniref:Pitrilysin family protein n=1 Tax=Rapidithrix thailandica TaxID=413964 RepID=A0AAW9S4Y0_9BACT
MIDFQSFVLDNGLKVIVHEDTSVPIAVVNIAYNVGSRDESEEKTGFAHLFEHLMFGGSKNIPNYDTPLQKVGGNNNAFTSPDLTNYYITLPANNLETAFWLESDRMLALSFDPQVLDVQKKVVIEEFKQRYLNQPYGDIWLHLRPMAYKKHPYQWPTIGREISHIENACMEDVKDFFYRFYRPNNAVLVVAGNVQLEQVKVLAQKWFGPIPSGEPYIRQLPEEARQTEARAETMESNVPVSAIYKVYQMCGKLSPEYHATDLLSDLLGRSKSARLYQELVEKQKLFSSISAYVTGSIDKGLLVVSGKLNQDIDIQVANTAIESVVDTLRTETIPEDELQKVKNQAESTLVFSELEPLNRAINLAYATLLGDTNLVNQEAHKINTVTQEQLHQVAQEVLRADNCSTLNYLAKK